MIGDTDYYKCLDWIERKKEQKSTEYPICKETEDKSHIEWSHLEEYPKEDEYEVVEKGDATGLRWKRSAEWSEEDEKPFNDALSGLKYAYEDLINNKSFDSPNDIKEAFDWLKELPSRFNLQPHWKLSKKDEFNEYSIIEAEVKRIKELLNRDYAYIGEDEKKCKREAYDEILSVIDYLRQS